MIPYKQLIIENSNSNYRVELDLLHCADWEARVKQALRSKIAESGLLFQLTWCEEAGSLKTAKLKFSSVDPSSARSKMEAVRNFLSQAA